jgi:hypothetical protein
MMLLLMLPLLLRRRGRRQVTDVDGKTISVMLPDAAPLPLWRWLVRAPAVLAIRGMLVSLGYLWIETDGSYDSRARVCVGNHISIIEPMCVAVSCSLEVDATLSIGLNFLLFHRNRYLGLVSGGGAVSRVENLKIPIIGAIGRAVRPPPAGAPGPTPHLCVHVLFPELVVAAR